MRSASSRAVMPRRRWASSDALTSACGVTVDTLLMPYITRLPSARTRPFFCSSVDRLAGRRGRGSA